MLKDFNNLFSIIIKQQNMSLNDDLFMKLKSNLKCTHLTQIQKILFDFKTRFLTMQFLFFYEF